MTNQVNYKCTLQQSVAMVTLLEGDWPVCGHLLVNWEDTQARPHLRLVNINLSAFVHCSSELNCILWQKGNDRDICICHLGFVYVDIMKHSTFLAV